MSEPFPPSLEELVETFEYLDDWAERYEYIIELGRKLTPLPAEHQTEENKVHGCMSTVWLITDTTDDNPPVVNINADSDSIIVKGLIVILLSSFSGKSPEEILAFDVDALFTKLGLNQHLSANRRNGLFSMVKRIRGLATSAAERA